MNNTTSLFLGNISSSMYSQSTDTTGVTQSILLILTKIFELLTEANSTFGLTKMLVIMFAIIGFLSVLSAVIGNVGKSLSIFIKIFVVMPIAVIAAFKNKDKRKKRLTEWGEIKKDIKQANKKIGKKKWFLFFLFRLIIPLLVVLLIIFL